MIPVKGGRQQQLVHRAAMPRYHLLGAAPLTCVLNLADLAFIRSTTMDSAGAASYVFACRQKLQVVMKIVTVKHLWALSLAISLIVGFWFFDALRLDWMLVFYVIGTIGVGLVVCFGDYEPDFLIKDKDKQLGPSYWGVYQGSQLSDSTDEQRIQPPKPCPEHIRLAGSGAYEGGKAIKGARS